MCVNICITTSAPPRQYSYCDQTRYQVSSGVHTFSLLFWLKNNEKLSPLSYLFFSLGTARLKGVKAEKHHSLVEESGGAGIALQMKSGSWACSCRENEQ